MLRLASIDRGTCALWVACDYCGERIQGGDDGHYEWFPGHGIADDGTHPVFFVHHDCTDAFAMETGRTARLGDLAELGALASS